VVGDGKDQVEFPRTVAGAVPVDQQPSPAAVVQQVVKLNVGMDQATSERSKGRVVGLLEFRGVSEEPFSGTTAAANRDLTSSSDLRYREHARVLAPPTVADRSRHSPSA